MDPLEQQIRAAFEQIPFGEGTVMDQEVIYSLELMETQAAVILIIGKENESLIDQTAQAIHDALVGLEGIEQVGIKVVENMAQANSASQPQQQQGHDHNQEQGGHAAAPQTVSYLGEYENVILIASGKGGVGKSTTAINLALALKKIGKSVSLLDADIYGPSMPMMMGTRGEFPEVVNNVIQPMSRYGIEFMSMGSLVDEAEAMVWRGPMAHQATEQMLRDTTWPGGDYMIVDLPPGTGDVQITLAQKTQAAGAIIVCTPQDVALLDARKAISMFDKVNIPTLGMVENMSFFKCPGCGEETPIFSTGGTEQEAKMQEVPFLGRIPIELNIRRCGDEGNPIVEAFPESDVTQIYVEMAQKLDRILNEE